MGKGPPPKRITKVFHPFLTTIEPGSGLGLSMAFSIVKNQGGTILAQSKVGLEAALSIYLMAVT